MSMRGICIAVGVLAGSVATSASAVPEPSVWQDGVLYVRFVDGLDPPIAMEAMTAPGAVLVDGVLGGAVWTHRAGDIDPEAWQAMLNRTRTTFGADVPDARQSVMIRLAAGVDLTPVMAVLQRSGFITDVRRVPRVDPASIVNNYQPYQVYENPSFGGGVSAETVWLDFGVHGEGVTICDIEGDFNQDHCDLPDVQLIGPNPDNYNYDDYHGTAVLGEVVSLPDGTGTTGIAYGADAAFSTILDTNYYDPGNAILRGVNALAPGSIIIIEVHLPGPNYDGNGQFGYVPVEWYEPWYTDVLTAVANGIIVCEAAGNGSQNLDDVIYQTGNGGHYPFTEANDSGAIMIGAGGAWNSCYGSAWCSRLSFSNYGSRVDLQGWGECVVTTGVGDFWSEADCDYTQYFGGTSSASPIVAGAVALVQSWSQSQRSLVLDGAAMRQLLIATGSPQQNGQYPATQHIGPLPDAHAAIIAFDDFFADAIVTVPGDYATIQQAIDASTPPMLISVDAGVHVGPLNLHGTSPTIVSVDGPESTIIDAKQSGVAITIMGGEHATIDGFTIMGGQSTVGSAMWVNGGAMISNCIVRDNVSSANYCVLSSGNPVFANTLLCSNTPNTIGGSWIDGGGNEFLDDCPGGEPCPGDLNGDGVVNVNDILTAIAGFGGDYDVNDILEVLSWFGVDC